MCECGGGYFVDAPRDRVMNSVIVCWFLNYPGLSGRTPLGESPRERTLSGRILQGELFRENPQGEPSGRTLRENPQGELLGENPSGRTEAVAQFTESR